MPIQKSTAYPCHAIDAHPSRDRPSLGSRSLRRRDAGGVHCWHMLIVVSRRIFRSLSHRRNLRGRRPSDEIVNYRQHHFDICRRPATTLFTIRRNAVYRACRSLPFIAASAYEVISMPNVEKYCRRHWPSAEKLLACLRFHCFGAPHRTE